ncbi:hypothetical protein [uncultured Pontibacter sp.]|uniref:hypothetical protein n=1 Tax=uncultured Pontibacter sp. TaxID=453356 RepID=UPI00262731C1|nr:hypothetical protein [uncultured Pontibacter sp.]
MRNSIFLVGHVALLQAMGYVDGNFEPDFKRAAASGVKFTNGMEYLRLNITNKGGIVDLLTANTQQVDGECTFNGNILEDARNLALEKIRLGYAKSAKAGGETDPTLLKYSNLYDDVPAVLANADLVIAQDGKDILTIPVRHLLVGSKSEQVSGAVDAFESGVIKVLRSKSKINVQLRFPKGASIGNVDNHFIELHFIGAATTR